jgi:hypothetical protein
MIAVGSTRRDSMAASITPRIVPWPFGRSPPSAVATAAAVDATPPVLRECIGGRGIAGWAARGPAMPYWRGAAAQPPERPIERVPKRRLRNPSAGRRVPRHEQNGSRRRTTATMRRLLLTLGLLMGASVALGGCVVAPAYPPGSYRPYSRGYYGPPPGRYYGDRPWPGYRYGYERRPYWR